ncbi:MAG: sialidase family protein, partial [Acidimicrobiales bacterium]
FNLTVTGTTGSGQATLSEPHLAVGADGTVFGISTVSTPRGIGTVATQPMQLATSTDHGKTWSFSPVSPAVGAASEPVITWIPQGGAQGTLVVAYQYKASASLGNSDIFVQRSTDGGKTWSPAMRLNDDPNNGSEHALPSIDAAPNGRIDVVWYDFRRNLGFAEDVYYAYSTTDGASWAHNVRVNDRPINLSLGISANSDVRQPPGVASSNQAAVVGWADPRLANATDETQDDYSSTVQFAPFPASGNQVLPYVAAIFGGLAAAGILLIVILWMRGRGREGEGSPVRPEEAGVTAEGLAPEA